MSRAAIRRVAIAVTFAMVASLSAPMTQVWATDNATTDETQTQDASTDVDPICDPNVAVRIAATPAAD